MPDNITGIMTSKAVFYAMDPAYLERYAGFKDYISEMSVNLSHDEIKRITAEIQTARTETRESFFVDDEGAAHISVSGPLEPKADVCAIMFGIEMTTYADIIEETRKAEADNNIMKIIYHFDTPGGNVVGLFAAADEIRGTKKPTLAIVNGMAASAGYALASQADDIQTVNISNEIGSIGVVTEITDRSGQEAGKGVKRHVLTSSNAENKRPDVTTAAGRDKIIKRLTDLESVFVEYVASGRNTTTEDILTNFGRGGILIARDARTVGMIDSIQSEINPVTIQNTTDEGTTNSTEENSMEMTAEQLEKFGKDIAAETAATVRTEMTADFDKRDQMRSAEIERTAGFTKLKNKYPEMSTMIDDEMNKADSKADLDFAMKVADSDKARIAAAKDQEKDSDNAQDNLIPDGNAGSETDNSGNMLASSLGLKPLKGAK